MTLTKKPVLEFFLNEKVHSMSSVVLTASVVGFLAIIALEVVAGITLPLWQQIMIVAPFLCALGGAVFLGAAIFPMMADRGEYSASSTSFLRGAGTACSIASGFFIVMMVTSRFPHAQEYFWPLMLLRILAGAILGLGYQTIMKWVITKLFL